MFIVKAKGTKELVKVYDCHCPDYIDNHEGDNFFTMFLIYENGRWIWIDAHRYEPVE